MNQRLLAMTSIAALMASMASVGCSKQDRADAQSASSDTVAQVGQKGRELGNDASTSMDKAKGAAREMAQDAKDSAKNATEKMGDKVADTAITTGVKTELAKDAHLSALKINVETDNGRVALHGTAPSSDAREHATALAQGVKGVVSVDNQLIIDAAKK